MRYEIVRFAYNFSSPVWSIVVFDRCPTHKNIRVLRRVFQAIELQAYFRVITQSRRGQDREQKPVPPRLLSLLHWPLPPLCGGRGSPQSLQFLRTKTIFARRVH